MKRAQTANRGEDGDGGGRSDVEAVAVAICGRWLERGGEEGEGSARVVRSTNPKSNPDK